MMTGHEHGLRTPLKRVRGLGASGDAVGHWWITRLTSFALVPLTLWFIAGIITHDDIEPLQSGDGTNVTCLSCISSCPKGCVSTWAAEPVNAFLLIMLTIFQFHHAASGMQAVFEDYIHKEGRKLLAIYSVKAICLVLGGACVFSILKIAFVPAVHSGS